LFGLPLGGVRRSSRAKQNQKSRNQRVAGETNVLVETPEVTKEVIVKYEKRNTTN
jgi:hypothetical protein